MCYVCVICVYKMKKCVFGCVYFCFMLMNELFICVFVFCVFGVFVCGNVCVCVRESLLDPYSLPL